MAQFVIVKYIVWIQPQFEQALINIIQSFEFTVDKEKSSEGNIPINGSKLLICQNKFHSDDLSHSLDLFQVLRHEGGIISVVPTFHIQKSKKPFIAITISSALIFLTIFGSIMGLVPDTDLWKAGIASFIPALIGFLSQILWRHFRWH